LNNQTIALIGNPNVGKSVVFNALTGSKAHVANWPGVTVEKKTGKMGNILITDLPGVYSLTPNAIDDLVARNYIVEERPSLIIDILDATNLERNLYLGLLLKETGIPVVFVLNMMDKAQERHIEIDINKLSNYLKAPVFPTVAIKNIGLQELKEKIPVFLENIENIPKETIEYPVELERRIQKVLKILSDNKILFDSSVRRWYAIRLLENDLDINNKIKSQFSVGSAVLSAISDIRTENEQIKFASARYSLIEEIIAKCVVKTSESFDGSEFLDNFFLNKFFGIPLFLIIIWVLFQLTFQVAAPLMTLVELFFGYLSDSVISLMGDSLWSSFVVDGVLNGFGSIIIFVPNIFLMFFGLSLLEDSGYLARAAFVMDRLMYKLGLHGRSFVSMLLGFGCNIPAIMSTRTIENEEDRITTIMVNQNISCGARLPVYILIGGAVWGAGAPNIVFSLYALGIIVAIFVALILKKLIFKGKRTPFILELGDYSRPTVKSTITHMWERGREFLKKAGTIIFGVVIVMWILSTFPLDQADSTESWLYIVGQFIQPVFGPLHFGVIPVIGLIFGFLAKEVVIAAFGLMLGVDPESASAVLGNLIFQELGSNPVIAYSYLVFVLLYIPCVATIGTIKAETYSWKWTIISVVYSFMIAYGAAFIIQLIGGVYI